MELVDSLYLITNVHPARQRQVTAYFCLVIPDSLAIIFLVLLTLPLFLIIFILSPYLFTTCFRFRSTFYLPLTLKVTISLLQDSPSEADITVEKPRDETYFHYKLHYKTAHSLVQLTYCFDHSLVEWLFTSNSLILHCSIADRKKSNFIHYCFTLQPKLLLYERKIL